MKVQPLPDLSKHVDAYDGFMDGDTAKRDVFDDKEIEVDPRGNIVIHRRKNVYRTNRFEDWSHGGEDRAPQYLAMKTIKKQIDND